MSLLVPTDLEHSFWHDIYLAKIEKVLQNIWISGEIKDTYGLDLSWPEVREKQLESQTQTKTKETNENKSKSTENFNKTEPQQANKKAYWIIGSLVFISLVGLVAWLVLKKKVKK